MKKQILSLSFVLSASIAFTQIQVFPSYIILGEVPSQSNYSTTALGSLYLKNDVNTKFFQFDIWNGRIATTANWCVFYNTQTSTFNDLAVGTVYNYSDRRAKTNVGFGWLLVTFSTKSNRKTKQKTGVYNINLPADRSQISNLKSLLSGKNLLRIKESQYRSGF